MYNHVLHCGRKHFCCYCLQAFTTEGIVKRHIKDLVKINGQQGIKMPKKGEYVRFENSKRKIKSSFIVYADFESILVPEGNGNRKSEEFYTHTHTNTHTHTHPQIKNMLLPIMAINSYVLMISIISPLSHT